MDTINETVASLEAIVSNFEGLRKSDAGSFFSHPGKSDRNGANYVAVDKLKSQLVGLANRLEALR